jgi:hypothetical protein
MSNDELPSGVQTVVDIDNKNYEYFNFLPYAILVQRDGKLFLATMSCEKFCIVMMNLYWGNH